MLAARGSRGHAGARDAEPPSLPAGRTTIGTAARDIVLQGPGLAPQHCYIENVRGTLTLHPCGNACAIDGVPLRRPTRLTQGRDSAVSSGTGPGVSRAGSCCQVPGCLRIHPTIARPLWDAPASLLWGGYVLGAGAVWEAAVPGGCAV